MLAVLLVEQAEVDPVASGERQRLGVLLEPQPHVGRGVRGSEAPVGTSEDSHVGDAREHVDDDDLAASAQRRPHAEDRVVGMGGEDDPDRPVFVSHGPFVSGSGRCGHTAVPYAANRHDSHLHVCRDRPQRGGDAPDCAALRGGRRRAGRPRVVRRQRFGRQVSRPPRSLGTTVVTAPLGKGRAMATALESCEDDFLCIFDADMYETEHNILRVLRDAALVRDVDMLIGAYEEPARRMTITPGVYRPITAVLFPEVLAQDITVAFSGFRVLRTAIRLRRAPRRLRRGDVPQRARDRGRWEDRERSCRVVPREPARVREHGHDRGGGGRHAARRRGRARTAGAHSRGAWDAWVAETVELIERQPLPGADDRGFLDELAQARGTAAAGDSLTRHRTFDDL